MPILAHSILAATRTSVVSPESASSLVRRGNGGISGLNEAVGYIETAQGAITDLQQIFCNPKDQLFVVEEILGRTYRGSPVFARTVLEVFTQEITLDLCVGFELSGWHGREEVGDFLRRATVQAGIAMNTLNALATANFDAVMHPERAYDRFDDSVTAAQLGAAHGSTLDYDRIMALLAD